MDSDTVNDNEELRMWCVIRTDIVMPDGKWLAQVGHAFVSSLEDARLRGYHEYIAQYLANHQPKIVVKAKNETALRRAFTECSTIGIPCYLVTDLGRTIFAGIPTVTCLGIGPWFRETLPKFVQRFQIVEDLP